VKQVWAKAGASVTVVLTMLVVAASPAGASTGATVADAQPWHYWIAFVLLLSILGIVFIALPVGYYLRVWRLKHPRR
jgi:thiosulfate reductase cytochrome b subunit